MRRVCLMAVLFVASAHGQPPSTGPVLSLSKGSGQAIPNRPLRIVIPFAAGGSPDVIARGIAAQFDGQLGRQVIVVVDFTWHGWFVPARTPADVVRRLNSEARNALQAPKMRALMESVSFQPVANSPEEFRAFVQGEMKRYAEIVRAANIRAD
jgi:tripartite-type tricarboxylate transporter receptor subunit TctC